MEKKGNLNKKKIVTIIVIVVAITALCMLCLFVVQKNKKKQNSIKDESRENSVNIENIFKTQNEKKLYKELNVSLPIFMYHFILDDYGYNLDTENFVKPSTLEEQLKYIVDNGYQTVFVNEIEDLSNYTKPVALTFDDCFVYFYSNAYPLLKEYNQKASSLEEMENELVESKKYSDSTYNINVDTICYPIGKCNDTIVNKAKEIYKYGLSMTGGVYNLEIHDLYRIPRIYANRSMSIDQFANYLKKSNVGIIY